MQPNTISPELEAVAAQMQGWPGQVPEPQDEELADQSDFSYRDRSSNLQAIGWETPSPPEPVPEPAPIDLQAGGESDYREVPNATGSVTSPGPDRGMVSYDYPDEPATYNVMAREGQIGVSSPGIAMPGEGHARESGR
ncbi:MAG: hypothetical protein ACRDZ5_12525 [Acidimicrobiales bacterium]